MASKPVILVATATSRNGSEAAKQLLESPSSALQYTVRLGARTPSKLDPSLTSNGGELVHLDDSLESAVAAFAGATVAYIIVPGGLGEGEKALFENYLQAAKQGHTKHIVYLSGLSVGHPDLTHEFSSHPDHERALKKSGIPYTILRCTWFHENITSQLAQSINNTGQFKSSAGDGVWTSVAVADIGVVAVAVLTQPEKHINKVYRLEADATTEALLAEKISKLIGKKVTHINLTSEEYRTMVKSFFPPGHEAQANDLANLLVELDTFKRNSTFSEVGPDLEHILGRKGISIDDFLVQNKHVFV